MLRILIAYRFILLSNYVNIVVEPLHAVALNRSTEENPNVNSPRTILQNSLQTNTSHSLENAKQIFQRLHIFFLGICF